MAASVAALVAWCVRGVTTLKTMFLDFECSWPKIFPPTTEQQGTDLRRVNHLEYPLAEVRTEDKRPPQCWWRMCFDVPILREPLTAEELREMVGRLVVRERQLSSVMVQTVGFSAGPTRPGR